MSGPLSSVLDAFAAGARSLAEVEASTGLSQEIVGASVDHLVRLGRLEVKELAMGCPSGGCGSCASATPQATPGCGAAAPSPGRRGPVLVALTLRREASTSTGTEGRAVQRRAIRRRSDAGLESSGAHH